MLDWITNLLATAGLPAVAALMFAENVFPPIPSELIMPFAGFTAARGDMSFFGALLAGSVGSVLGATLWYWIGARVGAQRLRAWSSRYGRWFAMSPDEIDQAVEWFHRHGGIAVLIGRVVPGVRTLISVPAGIAGMPILPFLAYSLFGTLIWTSLLLGAGYLLEANYDSVSGWIEPVTYAVLALFILWYIYRVVTFGRRQRVKADHINGRS